MSRTRYIKPGAGKDEDLYDAGPLATLLYVLLPCHADREGRLEDRPRRIRSEVLPDYAQEEIDDALDALERVGKIVRYEAEYLNSKVRVIWIPKFLRHQSPHSREPESELPAPAIPLPEQEPSKAATKYRKPRKASPARVRAPQSQSLSLSQGLSSKPMGTTAVVAPAREADDVVTALKGAEARLVADAEFDRFWAAYPCKRAKTAARKAFDTARKGGGRHEAPASLDEILDGVERYIADVGRQRANGFPDLQWAMPASWLNAGRWADAVDDRAAGPIHPNDAVVGEFLAEADRLRALENAP